MDPAELLRLLARFAEGWRSFGIRSKSILASNGMIGTDCANALFPATPKSPSNAATPNRAARKSRRTS
jgi:hypothetical protein